MEYVISNNELFHLHHMFHLLFLPKAKRRQLLKSGLTLNARSILRCYVARLESESKQLSRYRQRLRHVSHNTRFTTLFSFDIWCYENGRCYGTIYFRNSGATITRRCGRGAISSPGPPHRTVEERGRKCHILIRNVM